MVNKTITKLLCLFYVFFIMKEPNMTWTLDVVSKVHELKNENGEVMLIFYIQYCFRGSSYLMYSLLSNF